MGGTANSPTLGITSPCLRRAASTSPSRHCKWTGSPWDMLQTVRTLDMLFPCVLAWMLECSALSPRFQDYFLPLTPPLVIKMRAKEMPFFFFALDLAYPCECFSVGLRSLIARTMLDMTPCCTKRNVHSLCQNTQLSSPTLTLQKLSI